jgi:hypothetical protein
MASAPQDHSDYVHGSQEIGEQQATYSAFMAMSKWGSLAIAALLAFLTIWFMPGGNFFGAAFAGIVIVVAGVLFLKKPKAH